MQEVRKIAPHGDIKGMSGKTVITALSSRGLKLGPSGASRAKTAVRQMRYGSEAEGYALLGSYLAKVEQLNEGAVTHIQKDASGVFSYAYLSLRQCRVSMHTMTCFKSPRQPHDALLPLLYLL